MTKRTFTTKASGAKTAVYEVSHHYPRGKFMMHFKSAELATMWVGRMVEEDKVTRCERVMAYLAERLARPAPVVVPTTQMELFA